VAAIHTARELQYPSDLIRTVHEDCGALGGPRSSPGITPEISTLETSLSVAAGSVAEQLPEVVIRLLRLHRRGPVEVAVQGRRDGGCATCGSQPDAMDPDDRASALDHQEAVSDTAGALVEKRKVGRVPSLRLEILTEGQAAQILHVGPYTEEHPTIRQRGSDGPDGRTEQGAVDCAGGVGRRPRQAVTKVDAAARPALTISASGTAS
jgi:hypothetical protein